MGFFKRENVERITIVGPYSCRLAADAQARTQNWRANIKRLRARRNEDITVSLSDTEFKDQFRFTKQQFRKLCRELQDFAHLKGSQRITLESKVLTALAFFATGSYQRIVGVSLGLSQKSVSKCIREVANALYSPVMSERWIQFPLSRDARDVVKQGFYEKFGFPGVCGAIDCTHVAFQRPINYEHCYFNRKGYHSINVQMICDSGLKILNVNANFGGATHDSYIWTMSGIKRIMEQAVDNGENVWLLGDSGYAQRRWLMTPITNAASNSPEARYTSAHVRTRNTIERCFGVLKSRFRCLHRFRALYYQPDTTGKIIVACSVLHNMLLDSIDEVEIIADNDDHFNVTDDANLNELSQGRAVRNTLVSRF